MGGYGVVLGTRFGGGPIWILHVCFRMTTSAFRAAKLAVKDVTRRVWLLDMQLGMRTRSRPCAGKSYDIIGPINKAPITVTTRQRIFGMGISRCCMNRSTRVKRMSVGLRVAGICWTQEELDRCRTSRRPQSDAWSLQPMLQSCKEKQGRWPEYEYSAIATVVTRYPPVGPMAYCYTL